MRIGSSLYWLVIVLIARPSGIRHTIRLTTQVNDRTIAIEGRIQFRSKSIIAYNQYHPFSWSGQGYTSTISEDFKASKKFNANAELLKTREKYIGQITKGAKKRLSKAISLLIQSSPETFIYNPITKKHQRCSQRHAGEQRLRRFAERLVGRVARQRETKNVSLFLLAPNSTILQQSYI